MWENEPKDATEVFLQQQTLAAASINVIETGPVPLSQATIPANPTSPTGGNDPLLWPQPRPPSPKILYLSDSGPVKPENCPKCPFPKTAHGRDPMEWPQPRPPPTPNMPGNPSRSDPGTQEPGSKLQVAKTAQGKKDPMEWPQPRPPPTPIRLKTRLDRILAQGLKSLGV